MQSRQRSSLVTLMTKRIFITLEKAMIYTQLRHATCWEILCHLTSLIHILHQNVKHGDEHVIGRVKTTRDEVSLRYGTASYTEGIIKRQRTPLMLRSGLNKGAIERSWLKLQGSFCSLSRAWSHARKSGGLSFPNGAKLELSSGDGGVYLGTLGSDLKKDGTTWSKDG